MTSSLVNFLVEATRIEIALRFYKAFQREIIFWSKDANKGQVRKGIQHAILWSVYYFEELY